MKRKLGFMGAAIACCAVLVSAEVTVMFTNTVDPQSDAGVITLDFTVDEAGTVALDASTTSEDPGAVAA